MDPKNSLLFIITILVVSSTSGLSLTDSIDFGETDQTLEELEEDLENLEEQFTEREKYILGINQRLYSSEIIEQLGGEVRYEYEYIDAVAVEIPIEAVKHLETWILLKVLKRINLRQ